MTDPISLAVGLALFSLVPLLAATTTSFLKIAVVMSLLRNALGVQQIPPNIALYGIAMILTIYIMAPVGQGMVDAWRSQPVARQDMNGYIEAAARTAEPMRSFLQKNSRPEHRAFFLDTAKRLWPPAMANKVSATDWLVIVPAFVVSELTVAFEVGFLMFMPFVIIDLIVSNILLAMGMMMVSPSTISLPLKLFLFVMLDGWTRLIQGLTLSYS